MVHNLKPGTREVLIVGMCAASIVSYMLYAGQSIILNPQTLNSGRHAQKYWRLGSKSPFEKPTQLWSTEQLFLEDDSSIAEELFKRVRVLCWIMTYPANLERKAQHVAATWGKRCNKLLFASDYHSLNFPTINITVQKGRRHLTEKTMKTFEYILKYHMNDADWFLKADDDTYVIVENLRYFLLNKDPNKPFLFGNHFDFKLSFMSGGAGYVVSKEALRRYGKYGDSLCAHDGKDEDVDWARCMVRIGVIHGEARDKYNKTLFHCQIPSNIIDGTSNDWVKRQTFGVHKGIDSISDFAISFHYIKPNEMYLLEFYVYHMKPYGILSGVKQVHKNSFQSLRATP